MQAPNRTLLEKRLHLSAVFMHLMLLAFLVDQVQQLCCPLFQAIRAKVSRKRSPLE